MFSIHQPRYSIYRLFDSLTLLCLGRVSYHGPADNALGYFQSVGYQCEEHNNPADFFLDVINGDSTAIASTEENYSTNDVEAGTESSDGNTETTSEKLATWFTNSELHKGNMDELAAIEKKYESMRTY